LSRITQARLWFGGTAGFWIALPGRRSGVPGARPLARPRSGRL